ncbi:LamG-like jellyroll fold domain-containing protein [Mangrovihabitans endophyticus]|nr:LamG-like jellyroll fold domain-containing protein [Mangrovihabitans endophyticus]
MFLARRLVLTAASLSLGASLITGCAREERLPVTGPPSPAAPSTPPPSAGVLAVDGSVTTHAEPGDDVGTASTPISVHYAFDSSADEPVTDVDGGHLLRTLAQNGGRLRLVPRGDGLAVQYPKRCTLPSEKDCPRAILEGLRDDDLNPGIRPLRYGASVLMRREDLADGANVLQKGYSVGGVSQYKLQVDHLGGHPSCVIVGDGSHIYRAEPDLNVADGKWHRLDCARTDRGLVLSVDGVERASVPVPASLSVANGEPLRIGGKGPSNRNDQFAGRIDDVYVVIA